MGYFFIEANFHHIFSSTGISSVHQYRGGYICMTQNKNFKRSKTKLQIFNFRSELVNHFI